MFKFYRIFTFQVIRVLTFARIWNIIILRFYFILSHAFKIHKTNLYPSFISIEPTNICNLQCPECPTGNGSSKVEKGKISIDLFRSIIPQIQKRAIFVNVYFQGEPFIHESIIKMASLIHKAKMISSISTNAHFINSGNAAEIVKSGITKIIVSLDGHNQETYELYRRNGQLEKVLQGIEALSNAKKELKSNTPLIELQCLLFKHTEHKQAEIKALGKKYGANITVFKTAQFYSTENIAMLPETKNSRYKIQNNSLLRTQKIKNKCWRMWSSCVITWQGNIVPCCFDKNHSFSYGNLNDSNFETILSSKSTANFKQKVHCNRKSIEMCRNCTS